MNIEIIVRHGGRTMDSDGIVRWKEPKTYRGLITYFYAPEDAKAEAMQLLKQLLADIPELEGEKK